MAARVLFAKILAFIAGRAHSWLINRKKSCSKTDI
jgi:hypothetical protein